MTHAAHRAARQLSPLFFASGFMAGTRYLRLLAYIVSIVLGANRAARAPPPAPANPPPHYKD
jgi:hypothetical protein